MRIIDRVKQQYGGLFHRFLPGIRYLNNGAVNRVFLTFILLFPGQLKADFDPDSLSQATVRVVVKVRQQVIAVASGFVWQQPNYVVTSLHVMDTDPDTKVIVEFGKMRRLAKVKSVLPEADLVLLEVGRPIKSWQPLTAYNASKPKYKSLVTALGFNKGALGMSTRELMKGYAKPEVLQHLLPGKAVKVLSETDMPSVHLPIYYLDGSLLPGYSGAPVVDENGALIGIGNGGLESGASSVSWVIPATNLTRLMQSDLHYLPAPLQKSSKLFSLDKTAINQHFISGIRYGTELIPRPEPLFKPFTKNKFWPVSMAFADENQSQVAPDLSWNLPDYSPLEVSYQPFRFVRVKTRSFGQMLASSGDPESMSRVLTLFAHFFPGFKIDDENLLFDVYTDAWYGLNIVVPHAANLTVEDGYLLAQNEWMCQTCPYEIQYHVREISGQSSPLAAHFSQIGSAKAAPYQQIEQTHFANQFLQKLANAHWDALNQESDFSEFDDFRKIVDYGAGRQVLSAAFANFDAPFLERHELNYFVAAHNRDSWFEAQGIVNRFDTAFLQQLRTYAGTDCTIANANSNSNYQASQKANASSTTLNREQVALCRDISRSFWVLASTHFTSFSNQLF